MQVSSKLEKYNLIILGHANIKWNSYVDFCQGYVADAFIKMTVDPTDKNFIKRTSKNKLIKT